MELGLDGKIAIVTGGGSGIGRATAKLLADAGASVLICDIDGARAEEAARHCGGDAGAAALDITDETAVAETIAALVGRRGRLDILCNNAGVMDQMQRAENLTLGTWERIMRVNATGTFLMTKAALPHMVAQKKGAIVNTASIAGIRGGAAGLAYTASKHAVVGMTKNVATMYRGDGIRCNAICPGPTATNISESMGSDLDQLGLAAISGVGATMGRIADPTEMASAIVFLASDAASNVNGVIMPVDSGWAAG
jgi:NAD(P)-dependent dehydrogenase (short-subunit alcohol dehydrogenase family)